MIVATALTCLAINLYHEARSEPIMGRYAVALVTMNRAEQSEERVCEEVFRRKQFSWTSGVKKTPKGWKLPAHLVPKLSVPMEAHAWETSKVIAGVSLSGRMPDFTRGAQHYHATYVKPRWSFSMAPVKRIGRHVFYVQDKSMLTHYNDPNPFKTTRSST